MFVFTSRSTIPEFDLQRTHQLKYYKAAKKAKKAEVKKLGAEVSGFRGTLTSKERELATLKCSHAAEVNSLKEQITDVLKATNVLKVAKEEASKAAEDRIAEMEKLKEEHSSAISQLKEVHNAEISKLKED